MVAARAGWFAGDFGDQRFDGEAHSRLGADGRRQRTAGALKAKRTVHLDDVDLGAESLEDSGGGANARVPIARRASARLLGKVVPDSAEYGVALFCGEFREERVDHGLKCRRVGMRQHHVSIRVEIVHSGRLAGAGRSADTVGPNDAISFQGREMAAHGVVGQPERGGEVIDRSRAATQ